MVRIDRSSRACALARRVSHLHRFLCLLVLLGLAAPVHAASLAEVQKAEFEGKWDDAAAMWSERVQSAATDAEARSAYRGQLRLLWALRRTDALLRSAEQAASRFPDWDEPVVYRARALAERDLDRALELLESFAGGSRAAQAERAQLLAERGRRTEALEAWKTVAAGPPRNTPFDKFLRSQAAHALGRYQDASTLVQSAMAESLDFLDARIALSLLFQEKYQAQLAADELNEAARLAPAHPDLQLARAQLLLLNNQLQNAEMAARDVLAIREDPLARAILARLDNISMQPGEALEELTETLKTRPWFAPALYEAAAAHYLEGDSAAYRETLSRIAARDPEDVGVYLELGDLLESARRNDEAFAMYRTVLARVPDHPRALTDMGLLAMREGDETTARDLLERGFAGDSFNIKAYNQLQLLDEMDTYTHYRTQHFDIRLKASEDSLLVPLLSQSLETVYADLVALHGAAPRNRTIVEVFPTHSWFSARVTGLPWIGGIPAVCFGDVVAMDSPRTLAGRMNWVQILRHEFGHVLALDMTRKKVPFWFTEGLSVYLEQFPRSMSWDENLKAAFVDNGIVPVDSLTQAFTRPRYPEQRLLAYHEAGLIVEDLVARHGWEAIPDLLHAFGEGKSLEAAVEQVLGESYEAFTERALEYVTRTARELPVWPRPDADRAGRLGKVAELVGKDDPGFLHLLAISQIQLGLFDDASATAKQLLNLDPKHGGAYAILGLADDASDRKDAARRNLEKALELGTRDLPAYLALAAYQETAKEIDAALDTHARALEIYPKLIPARVKRARLYRDRGDTTQALVEFRQVLEQADDAVSAAIELARLELASGQPEAAVKTLEYAVAVSPLSADIEALRGQAFLRAGQPDVAYASLERARRIDLGSVEAMVGMALFYLEREDFEEALYFAELALKYEPTHTEAKRVRALAEAW